MIVLDNYKNHLSIQFEEFYKEKNIIFYFPTHSSYITQPLDVGCFNVLKRLYNREFEDLIKVYINYIIKTKFFIAFKTVYLNIMTSKNIQTGFRNVGLMPYNPQAILSKFNVKLQTSTSTGPPLL